ncbi:aminotransferase class III-fold pyridoxal phosphate-dependent enzyme [Nocardia sp. NPDC006630]|uniref:aspartate aminotransferase family protein n=1 Tax=Nocardia sp. NPDC006630 TaxID=3157181 RepID=UPI0033BA54B1
MFDTTHTARDAFDWVPRYYRDHLSTGRANLGEMFGGHIEVASSGAWVETADGDRYLNAGGYGVFITGARHPLVLEEVRRQLDTHPVATRMFLEPALARAAAAVDRVSPDGMDRVYFCQSGTEAVEAAIKIARASGRRFLVSMENGYHGKTLGALSITAKDIFQAPFEPLLPGVARVPYGDIVALEAVLATHPDQACVVVEPVQGEAGVIIPPEGYLRDVARACAAHGALFVLDEIQTGLGRLGVWWGADRDGVTPDVLLSGKALGGGVIPVAAAITSRSVLGVLDRDPFLHTSTFSGAPLGMAAVCGALRAIEEEGLVERAAAIGRRLLPAISEIVAQYFGDLALPVRGAGLLIGIEFTEPGLSGDLLLELLENKVIANHSLNSEWVLRLTPPAVMTDLEVQLLLDCFARAAQATARRYCSKG